MMANMILAQYKTAYLRQKVNGPYVLELLCGIMLFFGNYYSVKLDSLFQIYHSMLLFSENLT